MTDNWVMDYETLSNCFVAVFEHFATEETKIFVVHDLQNDFEEFIEFLHKNKENQERHISYNGLGFDAQITEHVLLNYEMWMLDELSGCEIAEKIYQIAQDTIDKTRNKEWLDFYEGSMCIPQLDVFKLNHWDNPAKRSSLKWIQFSMDWHNIKDMPIEHTERILTQEQIDEIITYCINDVKSTKEILYLSKNHIKLRRTLTNEYGINLYSASEPKISKELFLHFLVKKTGWDKREIKYSKTKRDKIFAKDIILPYIKFNDPVLQDLLVKFRQSVIDPLNTKGSLKYSVNWHGVKTDFGLGGVHGARSSGIYEAKDGMTIMTSDVKSYYPNLAIKNGWSPAHIPSDVFCELYAWFYNERVKIPKKDIRNYVYKIILNSTYGLSNDKYSFLYDPQFTMQITINGQLSLMMLYEMIMDEIPGAVPLMQNTDGLETMIPSEYVDKYLEICKRWEEITKLELEHDEYEKLILADVNNYIAVQKFKEVSEEKYDEILEETPHALVKKEEGKFMWAPTKCKGRFEFHGLALHKNKSALIIPKALYNFFVHDITPEKSLSDNKNIFDYCIGKKIKGAWHFQERKIVNREYSDEPLQPTIRYYISKNGSKVFKCHNTDKREIQVESGKWVLTIFNEFKEKEWSEYGINDQYYLQSIYKEIDNISGSSPQLTLF